MVANRLPTKPMLGLAALRSVSCCIFCLEMPRKRRRYAVPRKRDADGNWTFERCSGGLVSCLAGLLGHGSPVQLTLSFDALDPLFVSSLSDMFKRKL